MVLFADNSQIHFFQDWPHATSSQITAYYTSPLAAKNYHFFSMYCKLPPLSNTYLGNWYHHSSSCSGQTLFSFLMPISNPKVILGGLPPMCIRTLTTSYQLFSYNLSPSHNNIYLNCCWLTCSSPSPPTIWLIFLKCRPDKGMFLLDPSPSHRPHPLRGFLLQPGENQHITKTYKVLPDVAPTASTTSSPSTLPFSNYSPGTNCYLFVHQTSRPFLFRSLCTCYSFWLEWPSSRCLYSCLFFIHTLFYLWTKCSLAWSSIWLLEPHIWMKIPLHWAPGRRIKKVRPLYLTLSPLTKLFWALMGEAILQDRMTTFPLAFPRYLNKNTW